MAKAKQKTKSNQSHHHFSYIAIICLVIVLGVIVLIATQKSKDSNFAGEAVNVPIAPDTSFSYRAANCTDTEQGSVNVGTRGINEFVRGTTSIRSVFENPRGCSGRACYWAAGDQLLTRTDSCAGNTLTEAFCLEQYGSVRIGTRVINCANGCLNGACNACVPAAASACSAGVSCPGNVAIPPLGCPSGQSCSSAGVCRTSAPSSMSFFVTSVGNGLNGGNFGGLSGADAFCQRLARNVGSSRTWHAYLSTGSENARDRIGSGPWRNFNGVVVANTVDDLHTNGLAAADSLNENGQYNEPRIDPAVDPTPPRDRHDILTGSTSDGRGSDDAGEVIPNCNGYTTESQGAYVMVGHEDRYPDGVSGSWNSAHLTNCNDDSQRSSDVTPTAFQSHLYCFAIN